LKSKLKILHLEDNSYDAILVERELKKQGIPFEKVVVDNKRAFENALNEFVPDVVLSDCNLPSFDFVEAIKILKRKSIKIPFIVVTSILSDEQATAMLEVGASDYILKDRLHRLPFAIHNAVEKNSAEQNLQECEAFNSGVLSSLCMHVAVINQSGAIITVNKKADSEASIKGNTSLRSFTIGCNYFDACNQKIKQGDKFAAAALAGIQSVFSKEKPCFEMEYRCDAPEQQRWFMLRVQNLGNNSDKVVISHQDITKRKIVENRLSNTSVELQETLSELHKILDSSLDIICTINAEGEFVNVSAASSQVLGYLPEELIGTKFIDLVHHDDAETTARVAAKIMKGSPIPVFENRYVHKGGKVIPLLWSAHWDEKLELMYGVAKDITDKKRLEKELINERDQFHQMFFEAPSAIGLLKGGNHVFEIANPLCLQLIGRKDIIGKTVEEVLPELAEQGFLGILDQVYQTGKSYTGKEVLVKVDTKGNGELTDIYIDFVYQPYRTYRNGIGNIKGVFFFINDVTDQILSRKEAEKSGKLLKGVIENSDDLITIIDATGKTIYASPAVSKKFGYTPEEIVQLNIMDVIHPDDLPAAAAFIDEVVGYPAVAKQCPLIRERKKDGSYIWIEGTLTNFLETDGINAIVANFRDVTELKKADEDNRFKANLLNTIGQAAVATDINGIVNYWNRAAETIYGWKKEEALGKNIIALTTTADTAEQANLIMDELKKEQIWSGEFKVRKKDGTNFSALITNSPIYDEQNKFSGMVGVSSDITEMKKLEELLEKTNRLAAIGSWEIDVVKGTVFWSDITKEIREVDKDYVPLLGVGMSYFKKGYSRETINQKVQECMNNGSPWDEELQLITFKGNHKWVRTIGEGEFLNGKCIRIHGSFQDVTEQKKAANKIIRSEIKLQTAQQIAQVGSWEVDIASNQHSWSNEFYRILGINEDVTPSNECFLAFVHPNDRTMAFNTIENAFSRNSDSSFNFRFLKNDEIRYASSEWQFEFDAKGNPQYIYGILRDLTKEKKADSERVKMISDMVQRNSDLEQFSYIISHNLRAPAANIIGCAEILEDETITPCEQKELLQGISKSATALDGVIKDINNILQVKGEINEKKEVIIFSQLVKDIMLSKSNSIDKHRVRILTNFSEVDEIYSLKIYMYSIFYNLIGNSIKFGKPDSSPLIEINSQKENGKVILTFKDNGVGIDLKKQGAKIFGLYKRFHSHVEGKGMGLFMVKTQVESLGGTITVASEPNVGTQFTIVFES
jgi:PAS domain S-box-containing protein